MRGLHEISTAIHLSNRRDDAAKRERAAKIAKLVEDDRRATEAEAAWQAMGRADAEDTMREIARLYDKATANR